MVRSDRPVFRHIGQPAGGIRLKKRQIDMQRIRFLPLHQGGADLRESRAVGQRQLLYMAAHRRDIAGERAVGRDGEQIGIPAAADGAEILQRARPINRLQLVERVGFPAPGRRRLLQGRKRNTFAGQPRIPMGQIASRQMEGTPACPWA